MKRLVGRTSDLSVLLALVLAVCLLFQTGCATIFQGRSQVIAVTADPPEAKVFVNGKLMSTTPDNITVTREKLHHYSA